jgi:polar amino acid transport system substrate-binding protein
MRLPDGRVGGWGVELAQAVLQRMGCQAQLEEMPFARALVELRAGRLDMLDGAFALPDRKAYAHFSSVNSASRNLVFIRAADRPRFGAQSLAELHRDGWQFGAQVGVVYGPAYAALQQDASFRAKLQQVPRRTSLWQMLALGRVDVVIADELSASHELAAAKLRGKIVATPLVVSDEPTSMAFSKATTDLAFVQAYDAALRSMQADGSYRALSQRYDLRGLDDAPPKP